MPAPISADLRKRVISAIYEQKCGKVEVAERFDISLSTVNRWVLRWEEEGHVEARTGYQNGHSHCFKNPKALVNFVKKNPDLTSDEISERMKIGSGSTIR